jgi:hypothetical protein
MGQFEVKLLRLEIERRAFPLSADPENLSRIKGAWQPTSGGSLTRFFSELEPLSCESKPALQPD